MNNTLLTKIIFLSLIIVAVALEVFADILFKKWSNTNKLYFIIIGFIIYLAGTLFWAFSLRYEFISKAGSVFVLLNLIGLTMAGVLIFKEKLSITNWAGIFLGLISILLIELF